jgi:heme-degrading monooxygenase HmoA
MYIAMNRFGVNEGREGGFETTWGERNRYLDEVEGFVSFKLLRGETVDGVTPYISHSTWESEARFVAWTKSDAFRKAHADARSPEGTLAGPPRFSGWTVRLAEGAKA